MYEINLYFIDTHNIKLSVDKGTLDNLKVNDDFYARFARHTALILRY
jgi:hypothetical protein